MYIPFLLMLRNESFFRFNRVVLLVIVVLSLVLPLCDVHFLSLNLLMAEEQGGGIVDVGIPRMKASSVPSTGGLWQHGYIL